MNNNKIYKITNLSRNVRRIRLRTGHVALIGPKESIEVTRIPHVINKHIFKVDAIEINDKKKSTTNDNITKKEDKK